MFWIHFYESLLLSAHILFGFQLDLFKISWEALEIVVLFFSFKGTTHAYLLKMLIVHNKKRVPSLNLFVNFKISTSNIIYKRWVCFCFLNFLIISLCNSSPYCWFVIISLKVLILQPDDVLSKNLWTIESRSLWYPSYFRFLAILNTLSSDTLSEPVLLGRSFKSPNLVCFEKFILNLLFLFKKIILFFLCFQ